MARSQPTTGARPVSGGRSGRSRVPRALGWLLIPELLLLLGSSLLVSMPLKRLIVLGITALLLLLLWASPVLPEGLLPFRGKWLRRGLAGFAILGLLYAGPTVTIQKVCRYGLTVSQVQQRIVQFGAYRPGTRLPVWVGTVALPRWIGGIPIQALVAVCLVLCGVQFKLLWDALDPSPPPAQDQAEAAGP